VLLLEVKSTLVDSSKYAFSSILWASFESYLRGIDQDIRSCRTFVSDLNPQYRHWYCLAVQHLCCLESCWG
jgi:hypothetical protein